MELKASLLLRCQFWREPAHIKVPSHITSHHTSHQSPVFRGAGTDIQKSSLEALVAWCDKIQVEGLRAWVREGPRSRILWNPTAGETRLIGPVGGALSLVRRRLLQLLAAQSDL